MKELKQMTKAELIDMLGDHHARMGFRCIHGHTGEGHRTCYDQAKGIKQTIGFFDIETFELNADWGFVFSYCIKRQGGSIIKRVVKGRDVLNWKVRDRKIVEQFCEDVKEFSALVVFYGKDTGGKFQRHDIPFMRTRALRWGIKNFPKQRELVIIDIYDTVKSKLKQKSNSMKNTCRLLDIPCKETPIDWNQWQKARDGDDKALAYVLKHNIEDVVATEELYNAVYQYKKVKVLI